MHQAFIYESTRVLSISKLCVVRGLNCTKWIQQSLHTNCLIWSVPATLSSWLMVLYLVIAGVSIPTPWTSFTFGKQKSISFHRVDIQHVNSQVIGGYVERLKHLLQRHLLISRLGNESRQFTEQKISTILQPCRRERRHLSSVSSWWTSRGVSGSCRKQHECGCPPKEVIRQDKDFLPTFLTL